MTGIGIRVINYINILLLLVNADNVSSDNRMNDRAGISVNLKMMTKILINEVCTRGESRRRRRASWPAEEPLSALFPFAKLDLVTAEWTGGALSLLVSKVISLGRPR